jgi:hypothetical protein
MCLIINKPANFNFNDAWLKDFFSYNQDGFGIMYAEDSVLHIVKKVPKSDKEFLKEMKKIEAKEAVIHLRMRTHGEINEANTHPYPVLNRVEHGIDLWMVHNGVLSAAAKDKPHMSDTWHYIRDTIKPMLSLHPELLHLPSFQELIAEHIGNNRLVFMDNHGTVTTINNKQGLMFQGCWLSNTYAWSSSLKAMDTPVQPVTQSKWGKSWAYPKPNAKTLPAPVHNGQQYADDWSYGEDDWNYDEVLEQKQEIEQLDFLDSTWLRAAPTWDLMRQAQDNPEEFVYAVLDLVDEFAELEYADSLQGKAKSAA